MPTDEISSYRVVCEGGLNTNESALVLSVDRPGSATTLVNFESAMSGGYRRINGYEIFDYDAPEVGVAYQKITGTWTAFGTGRYQVTSTVDPGTTLQRNGQTLTRVATLPESVVVNTYWVSAISGGVYTILINTFNAGDPNLDDIRFELTRGSEGRVLWAGYFYNTTTNTNELFAARPDVGGDTYSFWKYDPSLGWEIVPDASNREMDYTYGEVVKIRHAEFNFGSGNNIMFVDGVNFLLWYDGTAWVEVKSTNAGGPAAPGGDQLIDHPSLITVFKSHIFVAGDRSPDGVARYVHSAPIQPDTWTSAGGGGQLFPGFEVVQIKPFRDELYVFGQSSISKAVVGNETSPFAQKDVTTDLGCIAPDSVLEIGGNLIFLSQDGIRPVAGTARLNDVELGLLSQDIQPTIDQLLNYGGFANLNSVAIRKKTQFRYTWGDETTVPTDARGLIGCLRTNSRVGRAWEFGELIGIRTSTMWSGLVNGLEVVLHGDFNGKVYRQETGSTFDEENILSIYSTPFLDLGAPDIRKLARELLTFVNAESTTSIFIGLNFDWDMDDKILTPDDYQGLVSAGESYYDSLTSIYDDASTLYGGQVRAVIKTRMQGSYFSVKFTFINSSTDLPFTIQGMVPSYSTKGRN